MVCALEIISIDHKPPPAIVDCSAYFRRHATRNQFPRRLFFDFHDAFPFHLPEGFSLSTKPL
jgi:hypothetical protein